MTTQARPVEIALAVESRPLWRRAAGGLGSFARRKPLGAAALAVIVLMWALSLLAPVIAPSGFNNPLAAPTFESPSWQYWFGTDELGREVFDRVLWAGRQDLVVSFVASAFGLAIALVLGTISAYFGSYVDLFLQRIVDAVQAMPGLLVLIVLVAVVGHNVWYAMGAVAILGAPVALRIVRAEVLHIRTLQYVEAAQTLGAGHTRLLVRHVLPNLAPTLIVMATFALGVNLFLISALAFLGLLDPSAPSWGTMLNSGSVRFMLQAPWLAVVPGVAITLAVFSYNMLGDALRDVLDPRLRGA